MKTIYTGGHIYQGLNQFCEAFVVEAGRFAFTGKTGEALALAAPGDEIIDLGGKFVCPGFNDSHMHLVGYGQSLTRAPLHEYTESLSGMISAFREFALAHPPVTGGWIIGRGWNQDYFEDVSRMPDRHDLDQVSMEHPVMAVRCCGHCLILNSRAIEMLNITPDTPVPEGGSIGMENGQPDGRLYDNAMDIAYDALPSPTGEEARAMIRAACASLNACGVTSCHSDDYALPWRMAHRVFRQMAESGELTVRVYEQSNFQSAPALREFLEEGNTTGVGDEMFRVGPLKMLGDGSLGSRTAYLSRPYSDAPAAQGLLVFPQETLDEMIALANEHDMQVAVHAIGDGCLDNVLTAIERALSSHPREDHRHGVVHCQITRPDQLEKMAQMNLHIYAQTIFLDYDSGIVRDRVGDLADSSYCWKTLMNKGLSVSNGTDCPVERPDSLRGIQCAVTRAPLAGGGQYLPDQAFTVCEAIDSYTVRSAEGSFEEQIKGRIEPGMLADFVVLDESPFDVAPEKIKDIAVLETWLGGRQVFRRG